MGLKVVLAFFEKCQDLGAGAALAQVTCYSMSIMLKMTVTLDISNTAFVPKFTTLYNNLVALT